jgi:hypothetical protein
VSDQKILEKAIQKAVEGGWGPWNAPIEITPDCNFVIDGERWNLEAVIYNHDFAKALWGETKYPHNEPINGVSNYGWQYHLINMVLADDSIKYLGENI